MNMEFHGACSLFSLCCWACATSSSSRQGRLSFSRFGVLETILCVTQEATRKEVTVLLAGQALVCLLACLHRWK